jgi:hypothetical protein
MLEELDTYRGIIEDNQASEYFDGEEGVMYKAICACVRQSGEIERLRNQVLLDQEALMAAEQFVISVLPLIKAAQGKNP